MSQALDPITLRHVEKLTDGLVGDFAGVFSRETIERSMAESVDLLGGARSPTSSRYSRTASGESACGHWKGA